MKKTRHKLKADREWIRRRAISFIDAWAKQMMIGFREPERSGIRKGDLIGLSRKKACALYHMSLFPRTWKLKEIAQICETSEGMLQVWRTEDHFKAEIEKANRLLGQGIANTLEFISTITDKVAFEELRPLLTIEKIQEIGRGQRANPTNPKEPHFEIPSGEDPQVFGALLIDILSFLDPSVSIPFVELLARNPLSPTMFLFFYWFGESRSALDSKNKRRWEVQNLPVTKLIILTFTKMLSDPDYRKHIGEEKFKDLSEFFRGFVFEKLDALATKREV